MAKTANHPTPVIPGQRPHSRNLSGSFTGFFARTGNSRSDSVAVIRHIAKIARMRRSLSFLFENFKGIIPFLILGYYFDRRNFVKARKWSDRFLRQNAAPYYAVGLATDALLMISEKRFSEAEHQFSESLKRLPDIYDEHDEDYVRRFAELWLIIIASANNRADFEKHGGEAGLLKAREDLANARASRWLKRRLRLPNPDKLDIWSDASGSIEQQIFIEKISPLSCSIQFGF